MRATKSELPVMLQAGPAAIRGTEWGGMRVVIVSVPAGTDFAPLLSGLPDDLCPAPHWGYIIKGSLRIDYGYCEELLTAGDVYYMPPRHTGVAVEDLEFLEVVPAAAHQAFLENAQRNLAYSAL
jgi:hypothetical protein